MGSSDEAEPHETLQKSGANLSALGVGDITIRFQELTDTHGDQRLLVVLRRRERGDLSWLLALHSALGLRRGSGGLFLITHDSRGLSKSLHGEF